MNSADSHTFGCFRHKKKKISKAREDTECFLVYVCFPEEFAFRIPTPALLFLFEQRPTLLSALPPALNKTVSPQKQTTHLPWEGNACWAEGERNLHEEEEIKEKWFFLSDFFTSL